MNSVYLLPESVKLENFRLFLSQDYGTVLMMLHLKSISSKLELNNKLKMYFMDKLNPSYVCTSTRLLCPNCNILR
jgi:hypothetical protein